MRGMWTAAAAVIAGSACARAQNCDGWFAIGDPAPRNLQAMALDTSRGRIVMFGGVPTGVNTNNRPVSETWEFDGSRWEFASLEGPVARYGAAMAFDSARGLSVMFGGAARSTAPNVSPDIVVSSGDTWTWDGENWNQVATTGPTARTYAAMVYDPVRETTYLFGGGSGAAMSELWAWDGAGWTRVAQEGVWPPAMARPSMVWDPVRQAAVLTSLSTSGTWAWDGAAWTPISGAGPVTTSRLVWDGARQRVVAVPTFSVATLQVLEGDSWATVSLNNPGFASELTVAPDPVTGELIGSGRLTSTAYVIDGSTVRLVGTTWQPEPLRNGPRARQNVPMDFDPALGGCVIAGGLSSFGAPIDTWLLRGQTWKRLATTGIPVTPSGTAPLLSHDPGRGVTVFTGSFTTLQLGPAGWSAIGGSNGLGGGSVVVSAYDAGRGGVVALSGSSVSPSIFNGMRWSIIPGITVQGPLGDMSSVAMEYDPARGKLLVTGGQSTRVTGVLNGTAWTTLAAPNSPPQTGWWGPNMVYDPTRGGVVCFGGFSAQFPSGSTYSWPDSTFFLDSGATNWTTMPLRGPIGRKFFGMAFDPVAARVVMYGGQTAYNNGSGETWVLSRGPAGIAVQPQGASVAAGGAAEVFVVARGGGPLRYQWRRDGSDVVDGPRVRGAKTDTLTLVDAGAAEAGEYEVLVTNGCGFELSQPATVTVTGLCDADLNQDGNVDQGDVEYLVNVVGGGENPTGIDPDFSGDGNADQGDIDALINVVAGGNCP